MPSRYTLTHGKIGLPCRVLLMDCPKDIARERVLSRQITGRADTDTEDVFEKRFSEFQLKNPSIVAYFETEDKLVKVVRYSFFDGMLTLLRLIPAIQQTFLSRVYSSPLRLQSVVSIQDRRTRLSVM